MSVGGEMDHLERRLAVDAELGVRLASEPVTALRREGLDALAAATERYLHHGSQLLERLRDDPPFRERFRTEAADDPTAALAREGLPRLFHEYFLIDAGAPEELIAKVGDDVVGHARVPDARRPRPPIRLPPPRGAAPLW